MLSYGGYCFHLHIALRQIYSGIYIYITADILRQIYYSTYTKAHIYIYILQQIHYSRCLAADQFRPLISDSIRYLIRCNSTPALCKKLRLGQTLTEDYN